MSWKSAASSIMKKEGYGRARANAILGGAAKKYSSKTVANNAHLMHIKFIKKKFGK